GSTALNGFDLVKFFTDQKLVIQKASFMRPAVYVFRDKFPPYMEGLRKKLLAEKFRDIPFFLAID
ncbi:MAG: hypothetical protein M3015_10115, partial [Bacteroidota bacterium]|nr:hypothetical protein [Bacteroidota bacterium]